MADYMAQRRATRRELLLILKGSKCELCGSTDNLEFDHVVPGTQDFRLSGAGLDKAWTKILEELNKCQLLCGPCHRAKTVTKKETGGGWNKGMTMQGNKVVPVHGTANMYSTHKCNCIDCKYAKSQYRLGRISFHEQVRAPEAYTGKVGRRATQSGVAQSGRADDC